MRYLLLLIVFLAGCENSVSVFQMEACQKACAPRPMKRVSDKTCECFVGEAGK